MFEISATLLTVILFWVSVPVLSEHIVEVEPRVSTESRHLIRQFFLAIFFAVSVRHNVTVTRSPSSEFPFVKDDFCG